METGLVDDNVPGFVGGVINMIGGIPFMIRMCSSKGKENADYYTNVATYRDVAFFASATYSYLGRYT